MGNVSATRRKGVSKELERFCKPTGLYETCPWEDKVVRRWIMDGHVAPRFPGVDNPSYGTVAGSGAVQGMIGPDMGGGRGSAAGSGSPQLVQTEECPICFMHYEGVNTTVCCSKPLCTECYLQVRPPRSSVVCPFCNCAKFAVAYRGPPSEEESKRRMAEEQRTIEARIHAEQEDRERQAESRAALEAALGSGGDSLGPSGGGGAGRPSEAALSSSASSSLRPYEFASTSTSASTSSLARPPPTMSVATVAERRLTEERIRNQIVHLPSASNSLSASSSSGMGNSGGAIPFESSLQRHRQASRGRGSRSSRRASLPFDSEDESASDFQEQVEGLGGNGEQGEIQQVEDLMLMEALRLSVLEEQARRERSGDLMRRHVAEAAAASSASSSATTATSSSGSAGQFAARASAQAGSGVASPEPGSLSSRFLSSYMDRPVHHHHHPQRPLHRSPGQVRPPLSSSATLSDANPSDHTSGLGGGGFAGHQMLWESGGLTLTYDNERGSGPVGGDPEESGESVIGGGLAGQGIGRGVGGGGRSTEGAGIGGEAAQSRTSAVASGAGGQLLAAARGGGDIEPGVTGERGAGLVIGAFGGGNALESTGKGAFMREAGAGTEDYPSELPESEEEQLKLAIALSLRSGSQEVERDAAMASGTASGMVTPTRRRYSARGETARDAIGNANPDVDEETVEKVDASLAGEESFVPCSPPRSLWTRPLENPPNFDHKAKEAYVMMKAAKAFLEAAEAAEAVSRRDPAEEGARGEGARGDMAARGPLQVKDPLLDWFSQNSPWKLHPMEDVHEAMINSKLPAPETWTEAVSEGPSSKAGVGDDAGGEEVKVPAGGEEVKVPADGDQAIVAARLGNLDVSENVAFDDLPREGPEAFSAAQAQAQAQALALALAPAEVVRKVHATEPVNIARLEPGLDSSVAASHGPRGVDNDEVPASTAAGSAFGASTEEEEKGEAVTEVATTPATIEDALARNLDALLLEGAPRASDDNPQGPPALDRELDVGGAERQEQQEEDCPRRTLDEESSPLSVSGEERHDPASSNRSRELEGAREGSIVSAGVGAAAEGSEVPSTGFGGEGPDGAGGTVILGESDGSAAAGVGPGREVEGARSAASEDGDDHEVDAP